MTCIQSTCIFKWFLVTNAIILSCDSFTPNTEFIRNHVPKRTRGSLDVSFLTKPQLQRTKLYSAGTATSINSIVDNMASITPEGYGFSSPMDRVLAESKRQPGYHKAKASDTVIDVMQAITGSRDGYDVALVFDDDNDNKLLGLFTESDYIKFSTTRAKDAATVEQSATFLMARVIDFMTPAEKLVSLSATDTANVAIAAMKDANVRHIVVADRVKSDRTLYVAKTTGTNGDTNGSTAQDSVINGVVSMQDVMGVIQRDERLSLTSLQQQYPDIKNPVDRLRLQMIRDANALANNPQTAKEDIIRVGTVALFAAVTLAFVTQVPFLQEHADWAMIGIFVLGYAGIIFEEVFEFNKAGVALLMSTSLWIVYADFFGGSDGVASGTILEQLGEQLAEVSDICFFLLAASAIVEVVDSYEGFKVVTSKITTTSKKELFWTIGILTFILSAILNNLTVTIVMVSLLRKLIPNENDRRLFGAMVVVAANAGGVWTPIGDVTTTMLWINNQLSTLPTITDLFLPSAVCLISSLAFLVNQVDDDEPLEPNASMLEPLSIRGQLVFWSGIVALLAVPVFNDLTGLPPYLAMLTGLGLMWTLTDILHMSDKEKGIQVPAALSKLDIAGILFFLGILMSIGVLDKSGLLKELAVFLSDNLPSLDIIATAIGLFSALIDNVPLVAATM
jgi:Na+/H+ antiporter NhaD/arsenite permease-like protein/CBS domain-containing protein